VSAGGEFIAGYSIRHDDVTPDFTAQLVVWTKAGGIVPLGTPEGSIWSIPHAISADGNLIVGSVASRNPGAFLWDPAHGIRDLRSTLVEDFGLAAQLDGVMLDHAMDITPDGKIIVGIGRDPFGNERPWVVTIPEPSTAVLGAVGLVGVVVPMRMRRRKG
jgi:hypothetical protein